ncbi:hypothetical protein KHA90_23785 [Flavobacterium psychroterrae]|uniref:Ferredoxin n=1 Tax=Flavobacterium psychroterrae TaxID=2133767 RepID=A0ABS5PIB9_9FLAO|nr:hypothetical protein [Flavobacterium psychroterrae]MBS7234032.1 hypothetical protein [Flavobacterium psychroterrae]
MTISKCEPQGCCLQIPHEDVWHEFDTFAELQIYSDEFYQIIEMTKTDCFDD